MDLIIHKTLNLKTIICILLNNAKVLKGQIKQLFKFKCSITKYKDFNIFQIFSNIFTQHIRNPKSDLFDLMT